MNFFEHQDQAKKYTKLLIILFLLAVLSLIVLTNLLLVGVFFITDQYNLYEGYQANFFANIPWQVHGMVALLICTAVLLACLYRISQLKAGGITIANELGGTYVSPSSTNQDERKILNVVEEMAIASGTPVPSVYVLDDSAINAFAAGYSTHDAVIGITRGAIELLNREELQGVIAHEFSHILNGDMRINIKLTGILFGITFLALVGQQLLRSIHYQRGRDNSPVVIFLGLGLIIIGSIGMLFGGLIKAAVSRQREYLADASAVQFTRNPNSIGGALKKIGGWAVGSHLAAHKAAEYSHFYIAEGVSQFAAGFFKTHPPLHDRIRRIEPHWDGELPEVKRHKQTFAESVEASQQQSLQPSSVITAPMLAHAIDAIGIPSHEHVEYAHTILAHIPGLLLEAAHEPQSAYALALGLTLNDNPNHWKDQVKHLDSKANFRIVDQLQALLPSLAILNGQYRLPLIEICIPSLKQLSSKQKVSFKRDLKLIIRHDGKLELWEWVLYRLFMLALNPPERSTPRYNKIKHISEHCRLLLAAIAYTGSKNSADAKIAFTQASEILGSNPQLPAKKELSGAKLSHAIEHIRLLKPLEKPRLLKALCSAAQTDDKIHYREVELIRMIAEGIDCPMPPLLIQ